MSQRAKGSGLNGQRARGTTATEFRNALLLTSLPLGVPALVELIVGFVPNAMNWTALFMTPLVDVCLIVLASVLAAFLAIAGYGRQAKGVLAGAGLGLLAMGLVIALIIIVQP